MDTLSAPVSEARAALNEVPELLKMHRQSMLAAAFRGDLTADWRASHPDAEPATVLLDRIRQERRRRWEAAELARMKSSPRDDRWKAKYQEPEAVDESDLPELPEGWCWASLEALTPAEHPIVYGIILPGEHVEDGVPFVRPVDIENSTVSLERLPRTSPAIAEKYRRAALAEGDLVYSIVGTIGKWLIVPAALEGANITQSSVRIRPLPPIDVHYFVRVLQSPLLAGQIARLQFGNAVQRLNVDHVRKLAVPLPPTQEWQAIRTILDKRTKAIGQIEAQVGQAMSELKELDQAILSKAFRGELVPQDPNDEPASALLDRIRAERQAEG